MKCTENLWLKTIVICVTSLKRDTLLPNFKIMHNYSNLKFNQNVDWTKQTSLENAKFNLDKLRLFNKQILYIIKG